MREGDGPGMKNIRVPARIECWKFVYDGICSELREWGCGEETLEKIGIAVEELFTNIVNYAYQKPDGQVMVEIFVKESPIRAVICLTDEGGEFNPLSRPDPDFKVPFEERPIGGLGIYMVKKFMDRVVYERRNGCNVVTVEKRLDGT